MVVPRIRFSSPRMIHSARKEQDRSLPWEKLTEGGSGSLGRVVFWGSVSHRDIPDILIGTFLYTARQKPPLSPGMQQSVDVTASRKKDGTKLHITLEDDINRKLDNISPAGEGT